MGKSAPITTLMHLAIQEHLDGKAGFLFLAKASPLFVMLFAWEKAVDCLEKVSDESYRGCGGARRIGCRPQRPGENVVLSSSRMPGRMNSMRRDL